ncbi:MAG: RluA family pseudouridine synthase [Lachnospiraceae bacterium]|nr:RluA family pseudouridine synthase [Lachnospiraceae bacterium]
MTNLFVVSEEFDGERIDRYLADINEDLTRSFIQKLIKNDEVLVNSKPVKASFKVSTDDNVLINIPEAITPDIEPENIGLDIVYEDDDVILINKPKDMVVHPAAGHYTGTVVNALMYHCGSSLSGINGVLRPGIVHRIDKDTTGIIIACKNDKAHNSIAAQLKEHSITRRYYAIVIGNITEDEGVVDAPIGRHSIDRKKMAIRPDGKRAVTHFKVLERFGQYTFIECRLETGRTHQIRVHMASLNHPLLGDSVYGPEKNKYGLTGQTLHAYVLGFVHPTTGEYMEFKAELPEYFKNLLDKFRAGKF